MAITENDVQRMVLTPAAAKKALRVSSIFIKQGLWDTSSYKVGSILPKVNRIFNKVPKLLRGMISGPPVWALTKVAVATVGIKAIGGMWDMMRPRQLGRIAPGGYGAGYISWGKKCIAGISHIFCKTNGKFEFIQIRELIKLKKINATIPSINENGDVVWVSIKNIWRSKKTSGLEFICDNGSGIICSKNHRLLVLENLQVILKQSKDINKGDILCGIFHMKRKSGSYPDFFGLEWADIIGWYLAEGCLTDDGIQFTLNIDEGDIADKILLFFQNKYGISGTKRIEGDNKNTLVVSIYGSKLTKDIICRFVGGDHAYNKYLKNICFSYGEKWLNVMMNSFLLGDGYYDKDNDRWTIGLTRNVKLEEQIHLMSLLLNWRCRSYPKIVWNKKLKKKYKATKYEIRKKEKKKKSVFKEISFFPSGNVRRVAVKDIKERQNLNFYDIEVDCVNHLFVLANGIISHNSGLPANNLSSDGIGLSLHKMRHASTI